MEKQKKVKQNRPLYFRIMKKMMKCRYKRPEFVFLGEDFTNGAIILSNHEGTEAPMSLELYCDKPFRMWGTYEMNSGLVKLYKYQTRVYYHEKKHWNLHLARLFCLVASPLTNLFYKGLNLIFTYKDARFLKTIRESVSTIEKGENVVIFPEISEKGYLEQLEGFYSGFAFLAETLYKKGIDVPIYVTYFRKRDFKYLVDAPIRYSELSQGRTRDEMVAYLLKRCNALYGAEATNALQTADGEKE